MSYLQKLSAWLRPEHSNQAGSRQEQHSCPGDQSQALTPNHVSQGEKSMHKPSPEISPEGLPLILYTAFATLILALLQWTLLAVLLLLATFFTLHFFRDPERVVPAQEKIAVSPADGKIVAVETRAEPLSGEMRSKVSIFMNVIDVHVNRSPVEGKVQKIEYIPGKFLNASLDKSSRDNERNILNIEDQEGGHWTVVQIAGLLARRIVCRVQEQDQLQRGQRLGLIKFGSRVDLYLPSGYDCQVSKGDRVLAGQTILARAKQDAQTKHD
ncbi:MAG: phosphatidylserine decarboxylase family protein [Desulfohalobiaceae bacterium]